MDHVVFGFPDVRTRNLTGRALRQAGYRCFATGPTPQQRTYRLTVDEVSVERRSAAIELVLVTTPTAGRLD